MRQAIGVLVGVGGALDGWDRVVMCSFVDRERTRARRNNQAPHSLEVRRRGGWLVVRPVADNG